MELIPEPQPLQVADEQAMKMTGNDKTDLAAVAAEMGVGLNADGSVSEVKPAEKAAEVATTATDAVVTEPVAQTGPKKVEVPAKFQKEDGTVDVEKLQKSASNVDEMIERYRAKEREAQRLQNKLNNPPPVPVNVSQDQAPQQAQVQLTELEQHMAQDLVNEAAAQGLTLDVRLAIAQAKVMARGLEAKHSVELNATQDLRMRLEEQDRRTELQSMIDSDPELMSPQMVDTLWQIRQENPGIDRSVQPWKNAYIYHLGKQAIAQRTQQVKAPNPTGQTAKAPPTPVGPVARVERTVDLSDRKALNSLSLEELENQMRVNFKGYRGPRRY